VKTKNKKQAVVVHSGGMDSSICLAEAKEKFGAESVCSLSFLYNQRHELEVHQAAKICKDWGVDHKVVEIACLKDVTHNALMDEQEAIDGAAKNTLVVGRNGLMARLGAIFAASCGASCIYMGVVGADQSGYRDCSREYMDLMQEILRIDLADPNFCIETPLVHMTKKETMERAFSLNVLPYLLSMTLSCYEGLMHPGCKSCPACILRDKGIKEFQKEHPGVL